MKDHIGSGDRCEREETLEFVRRLSDVFGNGEGFCNVFGILVVDRESKSTSKTEEIEPGEEKGYSVSWWGNMTVRRYERLGESEE